MSFQYDRVNRKENKKNWPCTIAPELWDAWKAKRRRGDPVPFAEKLGVSRPVIENALNYGYVVMPGLADQITALFEDRIKQERETAARLNALQEPKK
jgi:hypothetical protein